MRSTKKRTIRKKKSLRKKQKGNNMLKLIGGSKQKAYVINLVDRVDRKNNMIQKFEKTIFDLEFIEAIKNENGFLGCSLSMQKLVQKAKDLNLETVLFFEDDNKPLENFEERWLIAKKWLDNNLDKWDIFNGGAALWDKKALDSVKLIQNLDNGINLFQADLILNANWIYLNKSSYDKILNWKLEDHPNTICIDSFMGDKKHFTTLFIYPFLGLQESGPSNTEKEVIRNYSNNSKQKTNDQRIKNMEEVSNKLLRL
jgi:GR25 family glycosyltransferase involved in LPS biosynthesis